MALTNIDDVAAMLRWGDPERARHEDAIEAYILAASNIVEHEAGPIELRTVQHIADGADSITLPHPVVEVTAVEASSSSGYVVIDGMVTPSQSLSTVSGWTVDKSAGIVFGPFASGTQNIRITYTTGYATEDIPPEAKLAATMITVDMWAVASQRAPSLDDQVDPVYLMPKVVRNLLAGLKSKQMPGFA